MKLLKVLGDGRAGTQHVGKFTELHENYAALCTRNACRSAGISTKLNGDTLRKVAARSLSA